MRIAGINIPDNKRVDIALRYIFGVGPARAIQILEATSVSPEKRAKDLDASEINKIKEYMEKNFKIEGELRQVIKGNIGMLKEIETYRGVRHLRRLPVHGQRTKTNSRTVRGNTRKTAGSGKRKVDLK
jgi:small subunit ribosomal protein S13